MSEQEPGRRRAIEYSIFSKPADLLANRVPADAITVVGVTTGVVGSYLMSLPEDAAKHIRDISGGILDPTKRQVKLAGALALGASYVCDLLDGAVARKSTGETFHGTIFDGIANKIVDTAPVMFFLNRAKNKREIATWLSFLFVAPMTTMIRSRGLSEGVPMSKTGLGARVGRVPVLLAGLIFENKRNLVGQVLAVQAASSAFIRYEKVRRSGNRDALDAVNRDLLEYVATFFVARVLGGKGLPRELLTLGLELAKLGQVKVSEAKITAKI